MIYYVILSITLVMKYTAIYAFGAFTMRSAGCAINDLWDKDIDDKVERTKQRPLASGELNQNQALAFTFIHFLGGFYVLSFHNLSAIIASFSIVPLIILYPSVKRYSHYPQFVLGLCMNYGVLVASIQITQTITPPVLCLYSVGVLWTVIYDTIYAHQVIQI